jgi:L-rhamnose mutarotase
MPHQHLLLLDLKDDPALIASYEDWHRKVWPGILQGIHASGINEMKIFRAGNRLVMWMETADNFDFSQKAEADANDPLVQEWETLMDQFQQPLPFAPTGQKWVRMEPIFSLQEALKYV